MNWYGRRLSTAQEIVNPEQDSTFEIRADLLPLIKECMKEFMPMLFN